MSEHKRTSLNTIGTSKRDKKPKQQSKTLRFVVSLPEPSEEACPEFNYTELLKSAERKSKASGEVEGAGELNGLDPLAEDDDEQVRQIARHFEAKYGGSSKQKQGRYEDYVDVGAGYDETDPFIDNTDAYDEVVPEEMTTAHGGFYINCGPLEFRKVADYSDGEDDLKDNRPKKVKRTLSAGEGNESDGKTNYANCSKKAKVEGDDVNNKLEVIKKKSVTLEEQEMQKKKRKRHHVSADELHRKKAATVKELLKEKREYLEMDVTPPVPECNEPKKAIPASEPDKRLNSSISDVIESVVNAAHANEDSNKESENSITKSMPDSVASDSDNSHDGQLYETNDREIGETKEDSKLPDNLSEELYEFIDALKKAAKTSAEGKCKFFSCTVNNILLRVERVCHDLPVSMRQNVYAHLGAHLPCTKDTLMKRAKKLYLEQEEAKIRKPLSKLKAAIDAAMPTVLENYTRACQKAMEEKSVDDSNGNNEGDEVKKESVKAKVPKRKFPWTEEIRMLLQQVVQQKIQCLAVLRPRRELPRDVLINFLEKEVRILWPPGWMKVAILLHHCQDVLAHPVSRTKRAPLALKKAPGASTSASPVPSSQVMASVPSSRPVAVPQGAAPPGVTILKSVSSPSQGQAALTTVNNIGARVTASSFMSPSTSNNILPSVSLSVTPSINPTKLLKTVPSVSSSTTISVSTSRPPSSGAPAVHTQSSSAGVRPVVKSSAPVVSAPVQAATVTPSVSMSKPAKNMTPVVSSHALTVTPTVNSNKHTKNSTASLPVLSQLSASVSITPTISRTKSATPLSPSTIPNSTTVTLNKTVYGDVTITKASNSAEKVVDKTLSSSSTANSKPKRSGSPVTLDLSPNRMNRTPSPSVTVGNPSKSKGVVDLSVNKTSPPSVSVKSSSPSLPLNIPDCISVVPSGQLSTSSASASPVVTVTPKPHASLKHRILKDSVAEVSGALDDDGLEVIEIKSGSKELDSSVKNSNVKPRSKKLEHTAIPKTELNTVSDGLRTNIVYSNSLKEEPAMSAKEAERRLNEEQETEAATDILSQLINESLTGGTSREQVVESPQPYGGVHSIDGAEESTAAKSSNHDPPQPADAEKSVQLEMARVMEKLMELQNASGDGVVEVLGIPDSLAGSQQAKQDLKHHSSKHKESGTSSKRIGTVPRRPSRGGFQEEFQKHLFKREEDNNSRDFGIHPSSVVAAHNSNSQVNNQSIPDEPSHTNYTSPSVQKTMPAVMPCSDMGYPWSGSGDVDPLTGFHFLGQLLFDKSAVAHPSHTGSNQHSSP